MEQQNFKYAGTIHKGKVTVDAVHPRLLDKSKHPHNWSSSLETSDQLFTRYCMQCKEKIGCTVAALRNHFENSPHESQSCVYCHGPVYKYIFRSEEYFHECSVNAMQKESDDATSLSKDEDCDTGEVQSVTDAEN